MIEKIKGYMEDYSNPAEACNTVLKIIGRDGVEHVITCTRAMSHRLKRKFSILDGIHGTRKKGKQKNSTPATYAGAVLATYGGLNPAI
jgi:hypothetical protein